MEEKILEEHESPLIYQTEAKFQLRTLRYRSWPIRLTYICRCRGHVPTPEIQHGVIQTGSTSISCSNQDKNEIPKANYTLYIHDL